MLSTEDFALLRELVEYRRANGWTFKRECRPESRDWNGAPNEDGGWHLCWQSPERDSQTAQVVAWTESMGTRLGAVIYTHDEDGEADLFWSGDALRAHGLRMVVEGLASVGELPLRFSSAFADGKASGEHLARKPLKERLNRLERQIIVLLTEFPRECRFHGDNFDFLGHEHPGGPPRCDSCKQPWRVSQLLKAVNDVAE